ncbi:MAG TPA: GNAT family N-acetyltransferase [Chloroflexi bacterium]|nr:GNAT family N-acetyltransferase [Chloroflexota bacterium]
MSRFVMFVRPATPADSTAIYALLDHALRQRIQLGAEDIAAALATDHCLLLYENNSSDARLLALLFTQVEVRPASLPATAPDRIYVRGVAFDQHCSPTSALQYLLQVFIEHATDSAHPRQLIAYGGEGWLDRALRDAGMTLTARVQYFALERLQKRAWAPPATRVACVIRDATPADLEPLARLDSVTFAPLWHYSQRHLQEALLHGPLLVAHRDSAVIGYCALLIESATCTIARLAVHPDHQRQGCGRALLIAALQLAQQWGCSRALLNTQADNYRSQQLYRSLGFRPTGEAFAVFVLDLPASTPGREAAEHAA